MSAFGPEDVHVWRAALDIPVSRLALVARTLSADELERAHRFHFQRDRDRFVAARGALRAILAEYLAVEPASVEFAYGPHGKPRLAVPGDLTFNLSHSDDLALVGVALGRPIGIDVERVRPFEDVKDLPARIFSAAELVEFERLSPGAKSAAFFSAWTRKEAFVKATGLGFSTEVAEVEVTFTPDTPARLTRLFGNRGAAAGWVLRELIAAPAYAAALALQGQIHEVRRLEWVPEGTVGQA